MSEAHESARVVGVVPAAGLGRRMGTAKQTLPYRGSTMTGTVVRTLLDAELDRIVVVTRRELIDDLALPDDPRIILAFNENPSSEMIDSIRIGLCEATGNDTSGLAYDGCSAEASGILVVPADMPTLTVESCRACVAAFTADPSRIVIATCDGRRGHPIIFPLALWRGDTPLPDGLRELPQRHPDRVFLVETDDPETLRDVDTPHDFGAL